MYPKPLVRTTKMKTRYTIHLADDLAAAEGDLTRMTLGFRVRAGSRRRVCSRCMDFHWFSIDIIDFHAFLLIFIIFHSSVALSMIDC